MVQRFFRKPAVALLAVGFALLSAGAAAGLFQVGKVSPKPGQNPQTPSKIPLTVHEWGTFLSVQGSDGVTLGGMVASEEVLPPFVESRSLSTWERTQIITKMETPVTYFYTDRPQTVSVRVDMPRGLLTHWYPMVRHFGPPPNAKASKGTIPGSFLEWNKVHLIPHTPNLTINAGDQVPTLWRVGPEHTWGYARFTDSALVKVYNRNFSGWDQYDYEKFLFYRGLGTFELPLQVRSTDELWSNGVRLTLQNRSKQPLQGIFAIQVENKTIRFAALSDLAGGATREETIAKLLPAPAPLDGEGGVGEVKTRVARALVQAGLFQKEAWAMVNSWEKGYFRTDGLRFLYIIPRDSVDAFIPLKIQPAPDKLVRVMVGRTEVLTPSHTRTR